MSGAGAIAEAVRAVAEEGTSFGDVELTKRVIFSKDDFAGPRAFLKEPVHFRLADSLAGAGGIWLWVFDKAAVVVGAVKI